jgi:putative tryptophan/tyrosine transport system substrate-binding protein
MRRREMIVLLGAGGLVRPLDARAAQKSVPVVGFLHSGSLSGRETQIAAFREGLADSGYIEGKNVVIEYRWAEGHYDLLPELVSDLRRRQVAVIVASPLPSALVVKQASATIPIVFMVGDDPIKHGLAASLNHPGGNATGVSLLTAGLNGKRLGMLHELAPKASLIAFLVNPNNPNIETQASEMKEAADTVGLRIEIQQARTEPEIDAAFTAFAERGAEAFVLGPDPFFFNRRQQLVALAARYAVPAIYEVREFVEAGGLANYGASLTEALRQVGSYTGKVLNGIKPADLPVVQPTRFELVINLKTAKTLGITVPPILLAQADAVIE